MGHNDYNVEGEQCYQSGTGAWGQSGQQQSMVYQWGGEPLENCNVVPQHNWAQNPAYAQWGGQAELAIIRLHKQIGLKTLDNGGLAHLNIMLGGP
jgi:hypothetical protein